MRFLSAAVLLFLSAGCLHTLHPHADAPQSTVSVSSSESLSRETEALPSETRENKDFLSFEEEFISYSAVLHPKTDSLLQKLCLQLMRFLKTPKRLKMSRLLKIMLSCLPATSPFQTMRALRTQQKKSPSTFLLSKTPRCSTLLSTIRVMVARRSPAGSNVRPAISL